MCGVAGIYAYGISTTDSVDRGELRTIRDHMQRRGPDGKGEWFSADGRVGLGHRRLSIIDLSDRASQPMASADGQLVVTFNGEIYNHVALRAGLQSKGYVFRTTSDTEVLLHLYADRGVEMLNELRGMFAFGLWDGARKSLLLARDPYGIKPLYVADDSKTLRFASQVRALLAGGGVSKTRDAAGQVGFYLWGSAPEPFTTYEGIRELPAGAWQLAHADGVTQPQTYFSIAKCWADACENASPRLSAEEAAERARAALLDSAAHHLVADVPVSAFLSGGVDSGALVGLMADAGATQTHGITLGFTEFAGRNDDEVPLAASVATHYGLTHHVRRVDEQEFLNDVPAILAAMDQPSIDGVNTWFVSKATAELGLKVAISGLGGDELFGGYSSFIDVPRFAHAMRLPSRVPGLGRALRRVGTSIRPHLPRVHPKLAGLVELGGSFAGAYQLKRGLFMPWELKHVLPANVVHEGLRKLAPPNRLAALLTPEPRTDFAKVAALEAGQYMRNQLLRDTDWASMAHSLEVRVPLVDVHLLAAIAPLLVHNPPMVGKPLLANAPRRPLPTAVKQHLKSGFSTPLQTWMRSANELGAWQRVPLLREPNCPWARRLAYALGDVMLGG